MTFDDVDSAQQLCGDTISVPGSLAWKVCSAQIQSPGPKLRRRSPRKGMQSS